MQATRETMAKALAGDERAARVMYLDYVNEFLTVSGFAEFYGIDETQARENLKVWRELHEAHCLAWQWFGICGAFWGIRFTYAQSVFPRG